MNIGFVIDDTLDKPDGVQQYVLTLGKYFSSLGHSVHYLAGNTKRTDISNIHSLSKNISVRFNQNRLSIPRSSNRNVIKQLLTAEKFDVLHVQMPYSPLMAGRIIALAPQTTAIVGTFHIIPFSSLERLGTRLLGAWQSRNLRRLDKVISVSEPAQIFAKTTMRLDSQVIPNVVDTAALRHGRKLKKYTDNKTNIVFLGRLVERKGAKQLLEATKLVAGNGNLTNVRVIMCGKGPLENELKEYVRQNQLEKIVIFEGFIAESAKADYLATADIAVFPSLGGESFGIVLIEAMAAGSQTVLGGNNVGYASVLGKQPEQLFEPQNSNVLAEKLIYYIQNPPAREKTMQWQQVHVQQYDVTTVGNQLLDVYQSTIAKRTG